MRLRTLVETYVTYKRSLGMRFLSDAAQLRAFCRAMGDIDLTEVRPEAARAFLAGTGPVTAHWNQKFKILGSFYRYAVARGFVSVSPLPTTVPKFPPQLTPHIYSTDELRSLLEATSTLHEVRCPLRPMAFRTLLLLLYGTGMRVSEALALNCEDIDLIERIVVVRDSKFYKTRLVPIGPRLARELAAYSRQRHRASMPDGEGSAFFATGTGHRSCYDDINRQFRRVRRLADVRREDEARYQPRIHDIRHTAAVHRLIAWYRTGADVQRLLPCLATYLGHVDLGSTQRYLSMTPELLHEASLRFERYARPEFSHE